MRSKPDMEPGEELRFNKFLVEIEKRRLEGKSSVKLENQSKSKGGSSSKGSKASPASIFANRPGAGSHMGKLNTGNGTVATAFPKKGRKVFVCPQKPSIQSIQEMEDSDESEPEQQHHH